MDGLLERFLASVSPYAQTLMYHTCCVSYAPPSDCFLSYRLQKD
jgi:hypothetical protein